MTVIEYIGSIGGIAGVLAFLLYLLVRHLISQMREDRKFMEDRLTKIIEADQQSREKHTIVLTELTTWLKAKNGSR
jgi:hypothetical protein